MCFDKRVLVGLGVVAVALLAFAPQTLGAAAPFLVMAACPLSMVVMMRAMNGRDRCVTPETQHTSAAPVADTSPAPTHVDAEPRLRELEEEVNRLRAELSLRSEEATTT
ncbi:MAG: DUF2933 domain-containing protein [Acidimicrobiia bacterium]